MRRILLAFGPLILLWLLFWGGLSLLLNAFDIFLVTCVLPLTIVGGLGAVFGVVVWVGWALQR